jgi:hypothetical protein
MRKSFTFGLMGLTLLAGCAAGTVEPTNSLPGTETPSGPSDTTDASVPALQDSGGGSVTPPHLGSDASTTTPPPVTPKASDDSGSGSSHDAGGYDSYTPEKDSGSSKETDSGGTEAICKGYAPPEITAGCTGCKTPPCQANGCYGGYWCEMSKDSCSKDPPSGCSL